MFGKKGKGKNVSLSYEIILFPAYVTEKLEHLLSK